MFNKDCHQWRETSSGLVVLHEIRKFLGIIPIFKWTKQVECLQTRQNHLEAKMNEKITELAQLYGEWDALQNRIKLAKGKIKNSSDSVAADCSDWFNAGKDKSRKKFAKSPKGKPSQSWRNPVSAILDDQDSMVESYASMKSSDDGVFVTEIIAEQDQPIGLPMREGKKNRKQNNQQNNGQQG